MSSATVCRVIKQFNARGSVTPHRKGTCGKKRFPFFRDDALTLWESKRIFSDLFCSSLKLKHHPEEGKPFSATCSFSMGVANPFALSCSITLQTVALLIPRDLCNILLVKFGMFAKNNDTTGTFFRSSVRHDKLLGYLVFFQQ